jgi:hypothetical protein
VWRCLIFGVLITLLLTGLILGTVSRASSVALVLMIPALWLTRTVLGSVIVTSDNAGGESIPAIIKTLIEEN